MKPSVTIVDYGRGNLFSIEQAARHAGSEPHISKDPKVIADADRVILPGVGAFGDAMNELRATGLDEAVRSFAAKERPLLGICLGMQMLFSTSEEFGTHGGLNLVPGKVVRLDSPDPSGNRFKIPHISWTAIQQPEGRDWDGTMLEGIPNGTQYYFVHSFLCAPTNSDDILSYTEYGLNRYCSTVKRNNIYGCQYHPEKSGPDGLRIYNDFIHLA